ncbi:WYL domain-containing protein [Chitinophaga sp.]|uniref:helix-turn-helix transcriptional regulator n=1 Tax=Chitinophaga sp. TaxID=1869181 RepID=UPI0031E0E6CC
MSEFKNPSLRYRTLDKCFRNTVRRYYIEDLIFECNKALKEHDPGAPEVSRRQIFLDINYMESAKGGNIELERVRDGKRVYYRYNDPNFSIEKMPITESDFTELQSALQILSHFEGMPQFNWLEAVLKKIKYSIPETSINETILSFDHNPYLKGIEYLSPLFHAIKYRTVLSITYQDFKSAQPYKLIVHPYFLRQYNSRWFLFGLNEEKQKPDWTLALDRIREISAISKKGYFPPPIDWNAYFHDIIGVTKPADPAAEILLHFYGSASHYVLTKALHGSQRSKWIEDGVLEVRLHLIENYELEQTILSFGERVRVVSPISLAEKIANRLQQSISLYKLQNS